jgi:hypothetical protein
MFANQFSMRKLEPNSTALHVAKGVPNMFQPAMDRQTPYTE